MTNEELAIQKHLLKDAPSLNACGCMGVYDLESGGESPYCRCQMKLVEEVNDSFYEIIISRSTKGIDLKAFKLGPVGGPYIFPVKT